MRVAMATALHGEMGMGPPLPHGMDGHYPEYGVPLGAPVHTPYPPYPPRVQGNTSTVWAMEAHRMTWQGRGCLTRPHLVHRVLALAHPNNHSLIDIVTEGGLIVGARASKRMMDNGVSESRTSTADGCNRRVNITPTSCNAPIPSSPWSAAPSPLRASTWCAPSSYPATFNGSPGLLHSPHIICQHFTPTPFPLGSLSATSGQRQLQPLQSQCLLVDLNPYQPHATKA